MTTRTLAKVRAGLEASLANARAEYRTALRQADENGTGIRCPRVRRLSHEVAALNCRLAIIERELGNREPGVSAGPDQELIKLAGLCDWSAGLSEGEP